MFTSACNLSSPATLLRAIPAKMAFRGAAFGQRPAAAVAGQTPIVPRDADCPLPAGAESIQKLAWAPATDHIAAGGWDAMVRVWEMHRAADSTPSGASGVAEMSFEAPVLDLAWKEDGAHIFGSTCGGMVKQWNLSASTCVDVAKHEAGIPSLAWYAEKQVLITASWDKTLKYWDTRSSTPSFDLPLPDKVVAMDVKGRLMIIALADRSIHLFDLENPSAPYRSIGKDAASSRLRHDIRCIRLFHDQTTFAVGGIDGRVIVRYVDEAMDMAVERKPGFPDKFQHSFSFKCHRQGKDVYPVNFIDTQPREGYQAVFSSVGGDGAYAFWDKGRKGKNNEYIPCVKKQSITCGVWNPAGDVFAYSMSYDWSKGAEFAATYKANQISLHGMTGDDAKTG